MSDLTVIDISETTRIEMPVQRAFLRMVEQFDTWWVAPMRSPRCQAAQMQARVGGMVWEDHGSSTGLALGTVRRLEWDTALEIDGAFGLDDALGGLVTLAVTARDASTTVTVRQRAFGVFATETADRRRSEWAQVLAVLAQA